MKIVKSPVELAQSVKALRAKGKKIGFVPTMGALHAGHGSLVTACHMAGFAPVVSIFVNPLQFGPTEDFDCYPRTLDADSAFLKPLQAELLYLPEPHHLYPDGFATTIKVAGVTEHLCGPFRPNHFDGVATVVAKLLNHVQPDAAFFGEKDWQQLQLVKKLVRDLDYAITIIGVPILRESDGLALSSRNRYLSDEERARAAFIPETMKNLVRDLNPPTAPRAKILDTARLMLNAKGFALDYLELAGADDCVPRLNGEGALRLFIAAKLGKTRLIDNWPLDNLV